MSNRLVARRYAAALVQIAAQQGRLQEVQAELDAVSSQVAAHADLRRLCFYPLLPPARKAAAMDAVLAAGGVSDLTRRFFRVLAEAARLGLVHEAAQAYRALVDQRLGIVEARVDAAHPLTDHQAGLLAEKLSARSGRTIRLQWRLVPSLLGGLKVQVGSTVYDASLLGRLNQLKSRLLSA